VQVDRLGSVAYNGGTRRYYPYGVEYTATGNDTEKYATYTRDSATGLDYAVNRYYSSQWGRFVSPDPSAGSIRADNPQTWNRYMYVMNDPVNRNDVSGLQELYEDWVYTCSGYSDDPSCDYQLQTSVGPSTIRVQGYTQDQISAMAQSKALDILRKASVKAFEALQDSDCLALFLAPNGTVLINAAGLKLDPSAVLFSIVRSTLYGRNPGFGSMSFVPMNDSADVANTVGVDWHFNWGKPYYSTVQIDFNITDWNNPLLFEDDVTALLHELGHAVSLLAPGFGPQNSFVNDSVSNQASQDNTRNVETNCTSKLTFP